MFNNAKYFTFEDQIGCHQMVIFGHLMEHAKVARHMRTAISSRNIEDIMSAGFIDFGIDGPVCYGESTSLKIKSRPEEDTRLAKRILNIDS